MNWFAHLLVVTGAGVAGYFVEPSLRQELTGMGAKSTPISSELLKIDLASISPEQLPSHVVLKKAVQVTDSTSGLKLTIPAASRVKLLRIENGLAVVSPGAEGMEGTIQPNDTNLREQLSSTVSPPPSPAQPTEETGDPFPPNDSPAPAPVAIEEPVAPIAEPEISATPPEPAPEPNPEPAPEPEAPAELTPDDIVKLMQESIKSAQIKSFTYDQVTEWAAAEPETIDGKEFKTGLVSYQGDTFLGVKSIQAKAYIADGKVVRWIMPKSGKELE